METVRKYSSCNSYLLEWHKTQEVLKLALRWYARHKYLPLTVWGMLLPRAAAVSMLVQSQNPGFT